MARNQRTMVPGRKEAHETRRKTLAPCPFRVSQCLAICWLPRTESETREPEGLSSCRDEAPWNFARRPAPGYYLVLRDGQGLPSRSPRPCRTARGRRPSCLTATLEQSSASTRRFTA